MVGQTLGHYRIVEKIGEGGMGVVYKAFDTMLQRPVAVKVLSGADEDARSKLLREARAASALDHPNICTIHEVGEDAGQAYIVMAFVEGKTLNGLIPEDGLPPESVTRYGTQIADALAHAHERGIVHRDLKSSNVVVTPDGRPKVLDFGLAKRSGDADLEATTCSQAALEESGRIAGTLPYMAPEVLRGESADRQGDIWALGVLLHKMTTGELPFKGESGFALTAAILRDPPAALPPNVPGTIRTIIQRCLAKEPSQRYRRAGEVQAALEAVEERMPAAGALVVENSVPAARIFISYKRGAEPDESLALSVMDAVTPQHKVFIDRHMPVGATWAERIKEEIRQADFLIAFLSARSVNSEMVVEEIRWADGLAKSGDGRPKILPVRVAFRDPFEYPLSAYLNSINWAFWSGDDDTQTLVGELERAISGEDLPIRARQAKDTLLRTTEAAALPRPLASAQPTRLEMPEGTIDSDSNFYVERACDHVARLAIANRGVTVTIKGSRQMGKSSLLIRTLKCAADVGKRVVFLDFQLFDKAALADANVFFRQFCSWLTDELEIEDRTEQYWSLPLGLTQRCSRYVSRYLLKEVGGALVLAMDEVDAILDCDFRTDFFSMLRSWHNGRATKAVWKQLDLGLVISTEPYQLIENLNQSPFNVGQVIELQGFEPEQVAELNERHGSPLSAAEEQQLTQLVGSHPYLIRRALYLVASKQVSTHELFENATADDGPFGDHLRHHLFRLQGQRAQIDTLVQVIRTRTYRDEHVFFQLRGPGWCGERGTR